MVLLFGTRHHSARDPQKTFFFPHFTRVPRRAEHRPFTPFQPFRTYRIFRAFRVFRGSNLYSLRNRARQARCTNVSPASKRTQLGRRSGFGKSVGSVADVASVNGFRFGNIFRAPDDRSAIGKDRDAEGIDGQAEHEWIERYLTDSSQLGGQGREVQR